jgi:hypothetical protein
MAAGEQDWKPGSFTKNFSWGPPANGLLELYESIRIGFDGKMEDVPREVFRQRVSQFGHSEYIPINFFLFNKSKNGVDHLIADELVFQALTAAHTANFDKLALFALNFSYVGRWTGADAAQRRPALWANSYVSEKVAGEYGWSTKRISANDIQRFVEGKSRYKAKSARKLSTNLKYIYDIGHLSDFSSKRVERWWVDALFLALDRLIEDRELDGEHVPSERYGSLLTGSSFAQVAGARSLEKDLATKHLVTLYAACGGRERFSDEHVRERTELKIPDVQRFAANDNRPQGAVHPSNPRILKTIPRACAMLAKYAGFDVIDADELEAFDLQGFIRAHTQRALTRLADANVTPTMSVEELMRLTREK